MRTLRFGAWFGSNAGIKATLIGGTAVGAVGTGYGIDRLQALSGMDSLGPRLPADVLCGMFGAAFGVIGGMIGGPAAETTFMKVGNVMVRRGLRQSDARLAANVPQGLESMATDTRRLIQQNLERMDGLRYGGYMRFPDAAEIGTIRSNEAFIDSMRTGSAGPSW